MPVLTPHPPLHDRAASGRHSNEDAPVHLGGLGNDKSGGRAMPSGELPWVQAGQTTMVPALQPPQGPSSHLALSGEGDSALHPRLWHAIHNILDGS